MSESIKPRLLFVYPNQFGYHTDSYKYCEYLKDSFNITYVCFDQGFDKLAFSNVRVLYLPYNTGRVLRLAHFYGFLIQLTRKENFAIIFTIQFKFSFILGLLAKSKAKILDFRSGDLNPDNQRRKTNNFLIWFDSLFFRHITVISEGLRNILGLKKQKAHILPLGADVFSNGQRSFERFDLLYVGSLSQRNIDLTISGFGMFLSKNKELLELFTYTIIGFGNEHEEAGIIEEISKNRLSDRVQFLGRIKYTDLASYFSACNIGVSYVPLTPFYEYQPVTKLFEYLLSGMAVIATGTHENSLVVNQSNGVLINGTAEDFCNGLMRIYNHRNSFNSEAIRKSVESYTWQNIVNTNLRPYLYKLMNLV